MNKYEEFLRLVGDVHVSRETKDDVTKTLIWFSKSFTNEELEELGLTEDTKLTKTIIQNMRDDL